MMEASGLDPDSPAAEVIGSFMECGMSEDCSEANCVDEGGECKPDMEAMVGCDLETMAEPADDATVEELNTLLADHGCTPPAGFVEAMIAMSSMDEGGDDHGDDHGDHGGHDHGDGDAPKDEAPKDG